MNDALCRMYMIIEYPNYPIISLLTQPRGNCVNMLWLRNSSFHFGIWTRILTTATQCFTIELRRTRWIHVQYAVRFIDKCLINIWQKLFPKRYLCKYLNQKKICSSSFLEDLWPIYFTEMHCTQEGIWKLWNIFLRFAEDYF